MAGGSKRVYECLECGLHYEDEVAAKKCEEWCKAHQSCNLEITRLSLERKGWKRSGSSTEE